MSANIGRAMRAGLWVASYISLTLWIICEDFPLEKQLLVFGLLNLLFMTTVVDDTPKEGSDE